MRNAVNISNLISQVEYHPFGTTSYRSGRNEVDVSLKRYKYVGKERDEETGLYYYGARYYAAWLCRFVSVDPLNEKYPELSAYQYASNRPIVAIDLDGLEGVLILENTYNKKGKQQKVGKATLIQNFYYTTNPEIKGFVTEEQIKYIESNIKTNYSDLENTFKHGYLKIEGKKYKIETQINFFDVTEKVKSQSDLLQIVDNDKVEGNRVGNIVGVDFFGKESGHYGGATAWRIDIRYNNVMNDYPMHTDGNTPIHEALHNIGAAGDHTDGGMNSYTGPQNLQYKDFEGNSGSVDVKASVRQMDMTMMQKIVDRAVAGTNNRLKIINKME